MDEAPKTAEMPSALDVLHALHHATLNSTAQMVLGPTTRLPNPAFDRLVSADKELVWLVVRAVVYLSRITEVSQQGGETFHKYPDPVLESILD